MKKVLVIILVFMIFTSVSFADGIDLSTMTTEELISLHEELDAVLEDRFVCKLDTIYTGNYIVGKDIKEGSYLFSCTKVGKANFWILTTYESKEEYENLNSLAHQNLRIGDQCQINLTEGLVLEIGDGFGTIQMLEKQSWAP